MFVPRVLRLKGVRERQRPKAAQAAPELTGDAIYPNGGDALVEAMEKTRTISLAPRPGQVEPMVINRGPRFTTRAVTSEYLAQIAVGIQLIFSDYALQEENCAKWLQERYRTVDGQDKFIHLTAILEHPNIASMKPEASQPILKQALDDHPSDYLELWANGHHVRRNPASYPPKFLPDNSFEVVNDDGLSFWDQRTIYVEPHLRNLCQTSAKVAHWLKEHGVMREKWLPVQAVHMLWNSCAFVVLSGSVMHEDLWQKWREADKPEDWKIMTKVEHTKRTAEYVALLEKENPKGMRKTKDDDAALPPIARPAVLPMSTNPLPDGREQKSKRKRRKHKAGQAKRQPSEDAKTNTNDDSVNAEAEDEPVKKRRA